MGLVYKKQASHSSVVAAAKTTLAGLADFADSSGGATGGFGLAPPVDEFVSDLPLPVYSIGLDHLDKGGGIEGAKPVAWRVFVTDHHDEPIGVAEVAPAGGGNPAQLLSYTKGMQVAASGQALADADATTTSRFEPRFLEIPGLSMTALWLHNLDGGEDRIIPIVPVPRCLRDQPSFSKAEFLDRVRPQATTRLEFNNEPMSYKAVANDPNLAGDPNKPGTNEMA